MRTRQAVFSSLARERLTHPAPLRSQLVENSHVTAAICLDRGEKPSKTRHRRTIAETRRKTARKHDTRRHRPKQEKGSKPETNGNRGMCWVVKRSIGWLAGRRWLRIRYG